AAIVRHDFILPLALCSKWMAELVTVFRSADAVAEVDAQVVMQLLADNGIQATLLDDDAPGVPEGAWEVRVDAPHSADAEMLISTLHLDDEVFDESHALDMVTVFRAAGSSAEMEAMSVKAMLESNGIAAMILSDSRLPNLPDQVRVPRREAT